MSDYIILFLIPVLAVVAYITYDMNEYVWKSNKDVRQCIDKIREDTDDE